VVVEAGWEVLERSPLVIDRYRVATMALRYTGGHRGLNSPGRRAHDHGRVRVASRVCVWASVVLILVLEIGMLLWVRDHLILDVLMLIHPIDVVRVWPLAGQTIPP
jgi:hypothetical protein